MLKKLAIISAVVCLAGCATVSRHQIEDDLRQIGVPSAKASCVGKELKNSLSAKDLKELAAFLNELTSAKNNSEGLDLVLQMENPEVVAVITGAALTCAFS